MKNHKFAAAALPLVLAAAVSASASDPQGPVFGANRYAASIVKVCAVPDTDDYASTLVAGEKLSVTVVAAKGSALLPQVTLVGPGGAELTPSPFVVSRNGRSATLKRFQIPTTGRWGVRVVGGGGTEGAYTIAFSVAAAPPVVRTRLEVTGGTDCIIPFQGIDGAVVDLTVTWKTKKSSVTLASIVGPLHVPISGVAPVARGNSISVRGLVLTGGNGTYELHLDRGSGAPVCNIAVHVTPKGRPSGAKLVKLSDTEPFLDVPDAPVRGVEGVHVRLPGGNFTPGDPPTVLFGNKPATAYVLPGGTMLDVTPPGAADGSIVDVAVIGRDGQSCVRNGYFRYVPTPWIEDLVDEHNAPVRVLRAAGGTSLTLRGTGFDAKQTVMFGAVPAASKSATSATILEIVAPAVSGRVRIYVKDEFDRTATSVFEVQCVAPAEITSVVASGAGSLDGSRVAAGGGARVVLSGAYLLASDRVTLGGAPCTVTAATGDTLTFTAAAAPAGLADLVVTDLLGEVTTVEGALDVVGWADATADRSPGKSALDALTASRGAVGDLDGDGTDDIVLVSDAVSPGTRAEFTRLLFGSSGGLQDVTAAKLPAARSDAAGVDDWKASAVALGDLDGDWSPDILIGGSPVGSTGADAFEARIFANDGAGTFHLDGASPKVRSADWVFTDDYYGATYSLFTPAAPAAGRVTALAVGDLDGDGDDEIVLGTDHFRTGALHLPLDFVAFYGDSAVAYNVAWMWDSTGTTTDSPALRIFDNRRNSGGGFVDATFTRLPRGESSPGRLPAYHARDVKLGDVNGDGALDIVVTWDDPTSVTPYGLLNASADQARVATRVLINDGSGSFTDETDTWMPYPAIYEFWQGSRIALTDLDGDGRLDLLVLAAQSSDGAATTSALRVLRNTGSSFVNVTSTALPGLPLAGTSDDNLRGTSLAVFDFDDDGVLDIMVGTTESLSGGTVRSTRLLRGLGGLQFADAGVFLPSAATDSGQAADILIGDVAGTGDPSILLLTPSQPAHSAGGEFLRVLDWEK